MSALPSLSIASAEDAMAAMRYSNDLAFNAYGEAFRVVAADPERLMSCDLLAHETPLGPIPLLRNGENSYLDRACTPLGFNEADFSSLGINVDRFLIIREGAGFAMEDGKSYPDVNTALQSMMSYMSPGFRNDTLMIPRLSGPLYSHYRLFDSHPGLTFYYNVVRSLVASLGLNEQHNPISLRVGNYKCDLAVRFCDTDNTGIFIQNTKMTSEEVADPSQNRGRYRVFENMDAPNKEHILIIGDSHSFTGLSLILSYFFRKVSFVWASRANRYGGAAELIDREKANASITIEEISERFFLRNFGVAE